MNHSKKLLLLVSLCGACAASSMYATKRRIISRENRYLTDDINRHLPNQILFDENVGRDATFDFDGGSPLLLLRELQSRRPLSFTPPENSLWHDVVIIARIPTVTIDEISILISIYGLFHTLSNEQLDEICNALDLPVSIRGLARETLFLRAPKKRKKSPAPVSAEPNNNHNNDSGDFDDDNDGNNDNLPYVPSLIATAYAE